MVELSPHEYYNKSNNNMIKTFSPIPEGFFGNSGLTATSANHIANLLKLRYQTIENELDSLNFVTEKMSIVGSEVENVLRQARILTAEEIKCKLDEISRCKGFIAFLREAIKCKNELAKEIEDYKSDIPIPPSPPSASRAITEADVIAAMTIGERVQYLATEARAATYGKYIHPDGILDKCRQQAFEAFAEPVKVGGLGRDTAFVKRENAISTSEIDALVMNLQSEQRKSEAALNGYKHEIEQKCVKDAQDKLDAHRTAMKEYDEAYHDWGMVVEEIGAKDKQARIDRRNEIEQLKIIIPTQYRDLYNAVNG